MKKNVLLIISVMIFGVWLSGCGSDKIQDEIIEAMQNDDKSTYATQDGDEANYENGATTPTKVKTIRMKK